MHYKFIINPKLTNFNFLFF